MKNQPLPTSFILDRVHLTWIEILWGYEHELLNEASMIELAVNDLIKGSENPLIIELAGLSSNEYWKISEILKQLSLESSSSKISDPSKKWLYLILAWIYNNLDRFADPLGEIEEIYADFDYPEEIESFVRYMPATDDYDPSQHTQRENEQRLYQNWKNYLIQNGNFKGFLEP